VIHQYAFGDPCCCNQVPVVVGGDCFRLGAVFRPASASATRRTFATPTSLLHTSKETLPPPLVRSAELPEGLSALEALAASKLAPAQAIAVNQAILKQTPSDVRALNRLARAQRALGRRDEAAATFGRVLSIDRQNGVARKHLLELANEPRER
jgi:Flp pilus assembly protein TadD